ncbi:hypothetical protein C8J57DRAFT_1726151 [Mycena rebaudengoi]|nr:hypothetical protein C8J57DRAFT_1726151 [Mycena rebaudengoi]
MDTGFGGAAMCAPTTTPYACAGAGGFHIEDQRCSHLTSKQIVRYELRVVQLAEYLVRIRAAANARAALGSDTVIITRSDEGASVGADEAIARCKGSGRGENGRRVCRGAAYVGRRAAGGQCASADAGVAESRDGWVTPNWTVAQAREMGFGWSYSHVRSVGALMRYIWQEQSSERQSAGVLCAAMLMRFVVYETQSRWWFRGYSGGRVGDAGSTGSRARRAGRVPGM